MDKKFGFNKNQKIIIISLMVVVVLLLTGYVAFGKGGNTRTVMMYIVGSNLESDASIASADLAAIDTSKVDLEHTNVLIYTGGTKKWHNFIRNDENAIYRLTKEGFQKLESYEQKNMGDPATFLEFLEYGYKNYRADKYDLIMYDHGGAIDGAIYDDFSADNLDLGEFAEVLKKSPFSSRNKIETVIFRTCLNGTVEIASVFSDYAKYLVASEEVSYGSPMTNVLGFLNNVKISDNGMEFGKKFVDQYKNQMGIIDPYQTKVMTYAVIDLSKIDKVSEALNEYVNSIDLTQDYSSIAITRSNMYQYGEDVESYDMIDLYDFATKTDTYSKRSAERLINAVDSAVLYNVSNSSDSHGLSVYLPYRGTDNIKTKFLQLYSRMNKFKDYNSFINKFNSIKDGSKSFSFNLSKNESKVSQNEVQFKLTKEQQKVYSTATYLILEKDKNHPKYYWLLYTSDDLTYKDGVLTTNIGKNMVKLGDKSDPNYKPNYTLVRRRVNGSKKDFYFSAMLLDKDKDIFDSDFQVSATINLVDKNGKPKMDTVTLNSEDKKLDGTLLNIKDFEVFDQWNPRRKIFDDKGKLMPFKDWEAAPTIEGVELNVKDIELSYSGLDANRDFYCLFFIYDMNGHEYNSNLIKIGK